MPNSIIWIGLVVVWIFVLLPMLVKQRPPVRVTTEAALASRVVHRGDDPRSETRRAAGAVATRVREHSSDLARDRPADDEPEDRMQDDDSYRREPRTGAVRDDDHEHDRVERVAAERVSGRRTSRDRSDGFVPDRSGRGGYDPEADALARAARYGFRRRAVFGGAAGLVIAVVLAVILTPMFWWVAAAASIGLAFYLAYLRRQVRIEEDIRRRRLGRVRRLEADEDDERGPRPTARSTRRRSVAHDDADDRLRDDAGDVEEPDEGDYEEPRYRVVEEDRRRPAPRRAPAGKPVAVDEDDPTFDELDDADEAALPRARGA